MAGRDYGGQVTAPLLTAAAVDEAAALLADVLPPTPLHRSERLSAATGADVWLKREDLQPVRSYKLRGAFTLIAHLSEEQRAKGVVAASAGNHAQGVAFAGQRLGVKARIYLPRNTPRQKRDRVATLGGDMVDVIVTGQAPVTPRIEALVSAVREATTNAAKHGAPPVSVYAELNARYQLQAMQLGEVTYLTEGESRACVASIEAQVHRPWDMWLEQARARRR